jgi:hypothetical protein
MHNRFLPMHPLPGGSPYRRVGMWILLIALVVGVVAALLAGGRPRYAGLRPVRATMALGAGVVLQAAPYLIDVPDDAGLACVLGSYVLLAVFALANIRLVGMPIVLVGLLLNAGVIGVNKGMPVRHDAIATIESDLSRVEIEALQFDAKRHLETADDRVAVLGDAIPIEPLREVVSFGDLILAVGLLNVVFRLLRPHALPRRRERVPAATALAVG